MKIGRTLKLGLFVVLALTLVAGGVVAVKAVGKLHRTHIEAFFDNSNGLFVGDEVRILGIPVGAIDRIEPQPEHVKITFWVADKYKIPADVKAVIISPQLITSRAIQLTPPYGGGSVLADNAVIPQNRTAVPMEWDDLRAQLEKLTDALQPTQPGGVSTLGAFINTAADNLRGQGADIRETIIKMAQAFSILGDHSDDLFSTIKNLSLVVSALQGSSAVLRQLNVNLAAVTALIASDPGAVTRAVDDLSTAVTDTRSFVAENRESFGTTTDKLASISQAVNESIGDVKQALHVFPTAFQNYINTYKPATSSLSGQFAIQNFANPVSFLCGAIQAASRLNAEQSSKLCVQYLAPIIKNRQYNFLPLGENLINGAMARPNEITYSEDWMRPDYVPPQAAPPAPQAPPQPDGAPLAAEAPADPPPPPPALATDPDAGLTGMMVPPGAGS